MVYETYGWAIFDDVIKSNYVGWLNMLRRAKTRDPSATRGGYYKVLASRVTWT